MSILELRSQYRHVTVEIYKAKSRCHQHEAKSHFETGRCSEGNGFSARHSRAGNMDTRCTSNFEASGAAQNVTMNEKDNTCRSRSTIGGGYW